MNKIIIAAAATLVVSATALTSTTAQAGGGVKLGFGFPLGSFVARPTSQPYHHAPAHHFKTPLHAQKSLGKPKAMVAHKKRIEIDDEDEAPRRVVKAKSKPDTEARVAKKKVKTEADEETTASKDPGQGGTVTAALTAARVAPEATQEPAPVAAEVPVKELVTVEPPPQGNIEPAAAEIPAQVVKQEAVQPVESAPASKKTAKKGLECRKFIPAVGVTISVRCEE
ncbi:MAG: hypothetical protein AB1749_00855 [Pseudomonadota bacterium]